MALSVAPLPLHAPCCSQRVNSVQRLRHSLLRADRLLEKHEEEVGVRQEGGASGQADGRTGLLATRLPATPPHQPVPGACLPAHPPPLQESISVVQGIEELGFLPGWGNTVGRVRESFQMLLDIVQARRGGGAGGGELIPCRLLVLVAASAGLPAARLLHPKRCLLARPALQAPDADTLEKFLGRLPLMFKACPCGSAARPCAVLAKPGGERCCSATALLSPTLFWGNNLPAFPCRSPMLPCCHSPRRRSSFCPPTATLGRPMCWACQTQAARWDTAAVALHCPPVSRGLPSPRLSCPRTCQCVGAGAPAGAAGASIPRA